MPDTIRIGSQGLTVSRLQATLNIRVPAPPLLAIDGIFGPLTRGRVVGFQAAQHLAPDGVVGPLTWAKLGDLPQGSTSRLRITCCNGDPANSGAVQRVRSALIGSGVGSGAGSGAGSGGGTAVPRSTAYALASDGAGDGAASALSAPGGLTLIPLLGSPQEPVARGVYGNSLQYERIFMSAAQGLQGRAFTVALPVSSVGGLFPNLPT